MDWSITNIPLGNLRGEFFSYYYTFKRANIEEIIEDHIRFYHNSSCLLPIYDKQHLFTIILQRVISGFEAFYSGAVYIVFGFKGYDAATLRSLKNETMVYGKGYCDAAFIRIPKHLNENYRLDKRNSKLYNQIKDFYKNVRNRLMHGCEFSEINLEEFRGFLELYKDLYDWLIDWFESEFKILKKERKILEMDENILKSLFVRELRFVKH